MNLKILLLVFCLSALSLSCYSLAPIPNSPLTDWSNYVNGTLALSPILTGYGVEKWDPITAQLVMWYSNFTGKAVIIDLPIRGISPEKAARKALREGAAKGYGRPVALLFPSAAYLAGFGEAARDYSDVSDIKLPAVEISIPIWVLVDEATKAGAPIYAVIRDDDRNPALDFWGRQQTIIACICLTSMCIACWIVNMYKFYWHMRMTSGITTAKIFFVIDWFGNFMRFFYVCINPFFLSRFDYTWTTICSSTHFALTLICTLLLALKWRELLRKTSLKVTMFLTTFKWPFIIISCIIFCVELVSSAMRGHWYNIANFSSASFGVLIVVGTGIVVLLYISGIQILIEISKAVQGQSGSRRTLKLYQTTLLILASGAFVFLWCMNQLALVIKSYGVKNISIRQLQTMLIISFVALFGASLLQNWAMPIPGVSLSSSSNVSGKHHSSSQGESARSRDTKNHMEEDDDDGPIGKQEAKPLTLDIESGETSSDSD